MKGRLESDSVFLTKGKMSQRFVETAILFFKLSQSNNNIENNKLLFHPPAQGCVFLSLLCNNKFNNITSYFEYSFIASADFGRQPDSWDDSDVVCPPHWPSCHWILVFFTSLFTSSLSIKINKSDDLFFFFFDQQNILKVSNHFETFYYIWCFWIHINVALLSMLHFITADV